MSQTEFRAALLDPDLPVPAGLTDPQGRAAGRRFNVYRNNVTASLTEALRTAFPVIRKLVGDDFFTAMAVVFLRQHPPTSPLLMFYGDEMPEFLATFGPVTHLGYLPDIARLELALRHAYHAADATPIAVETLSGLAPENLIASRIGFAPAVRLLRSAWPIHAIWMANMRDGPAPRAEPQDVLIVRPDFDPEPVLLPPGSGAFLAGVIGGQTVGAALETGADFDLTATLGILIANNVIMNIASGDLP